MKKITKLLVATGLILSSAIALAEGGYEDSNMFKEMKGKDKAAIMMVHFGTTYDNTRALTIDAINKKVATKFKPVPVYEAYTSRIVMRRLKTRGIDKSNPNEVFNALKKQGYTHIIVQGTNTMNGVESENLHKEVAMHAKDFKDIRVGNPLLTTPEDYKEVAHALAKYIGPLKPHHGVVLVGHGTHHYGGSAYSTMDYTFTNEGYPNFVVGTIEGYPSFDDVVKQLHRRGITNVTLMPFMFVAGDHANNDIKVDWAERLTKAGFKIDGVKVVGLGQNPDVQNMFIKHIEFAEDHKPVDMEKLKAKYAKEKD